MNPKLQLLSIVLFQVIVKIIAEYEQMLQKKHALLNRVESATSETERQLLKKISNNHQFSTTLLPIRSVGVQVCLIALKLTSIISIV